MGMDNQVVDMGKSIPSPTVGISVRQRRKEVYMLAIVGMHHIWLEHNARAFDLKTTVLT